MCYSVRLFLPGDADTEAIRPIFEKYEFSMHFYTLIQDEYGGKRGEQQVSLPGPGCDCYLISYIRHGDMDKSIIEKELVKLRKKGWGEGKIQRWLDDKERGIANRHASSEHRHAKSFLSFVCDVYQVVDYLAIYIHWLSNDEALNNIQEERFTQVDLNSELISKLDDEIRYVFRRSKLYYGS